MTERIDWSKRASYIQGRHGLETRWADEAVDDADAAWLDPDPTSASGLSVRVIGYSPSVNQVLTVILLPADADPADPPNGDWWGVNAWPSNARDRRVYEQVQEEGDNEQGR